MAFEFTGHKKNFNEVIIKPQFDSGVTNALDIRNDAGTTNFSVTPAGNVAATGTLAVTGASTLTGNATASGTLTVDGASTLTGNTTVAGTLDITGALTRKQNVISGQGATLTLTAAQSGSVVMFDRAAGIVYTLPVPAVGLTYDFLTTVSITSNAAKVITDAGTTFVLGSVVSVDRDTANAVAAFNGNGSTHVAMSSNGTTTGAVLGSMYRWTCVSSTIWMVQGMLFGTGVVATPFATS